MINTQINARKLCKPLQTYTFHTYKDNNIAKALPSDAQQQQHLTSVRAMLFTIIYNLRPNIKAPNRAPDTNGKTKRKAEDAINRLKTTQP